MGIISFIRRTIKKFFGRLFYSHKNPKKIEKVLLPSSFKSGYGLSRKVEGRAVRKHNKLIRIFIKKKKRNPSRSELGRLIISASHDAMGRMRGKKGHWERQKIRKYLFNSHGIKYTKR